MKKLLEANLKGLLEIGIYSCFNRVIDIVDTFSLPSSTLTLCLYHLIKDFNYQKNANKYIKQVMGRGADIHGCISDGNPILEYAFFKHSPELFDILFKYKIDSNFIVNKKYQRTILMNLIHFSYPYSLVKNFLKKNPNLELEDKYGFTAIHYAIRSDNICFVDILIEAGVNVNAVSHDGTSPIMTAIQNYNLLGMGLLLASGANFIEEEIIKAILRTKKYFKKQDVIVSLLKFCQDNQYYSLEKEIIKIILKEKGDIFE